MGNADAKALTAQDRNKQLIKCNKGSHFKNTYKCAHTIQPPANGKKALIC